MSAANEDLRDICIKSSFIVLGGIGFSGLNPKFNAEFGLYRSTVTTHQEDMELTEQFRAVYDKLNRCAGDRQVIVLTHMPVYDWTNEPYNPNWIYINGHTHRNTLIRNEDGTTVLSDNQIGYEPRKWKLNAFIVSGRYDPFIGWKDGIYEISSEEYKEFNSGRGIKTNGCNYPGKIYALKREEMYMFLLKSHSSLCLLQGGQRKRLAYHDIKYYYENIVQYGEKVREALLPYQQVIREISKEVKCFGGWGTIHGCIVDINFYTHIYLNPFDGKITPYYAIDNSCQFSFDDLIDLIKRFVSELTEKYQLAQENGRIPMLSQYAVKSDTDLPQIKEAIIPNIVLGTEMYKPSRIMRSIQYIFDDNVIRIWNDEILSMKPDPSHIETQNKAGKYLGK